MKRKVVSGVLALTMVAGMAVGCGSSKPAETTAAAADTTAAAAETTAAAAAAPSGDAQKLTMGTGGTTGTYYAFGGVIANVLNSKDIGVNINVQSTGASKANICLVNDGEADLAIVQNDVMDYAYNGTDLFAEEGAAKDFTTVAALYAEVCQIVSSGDIKSVADLKGKRVSVGDAGSGVEFNARQILEAYDISFDDIQVNNLGFGEHFSIDCVNNLVKYNHVVLFGQGKCDTVVKNTLENFCRLSLFLFVHLKCELEVGGAERESHILGVTENMAFTRKFRF